MYEKLLEKYSNQVEEKLEEYFEQVQSQGFISEVHGHIREYVLRKGKRLASCSTILAYKGYSGKVDEKILNACIGVELYRHSILIHDDLVDLDEYRRGGKAFHKISSLDDRFGEGMAIFSGNILYVMALDAIQNSGFSKAQIEKVISLFVNEFRMVNESQILDLLFEYTQPSVEEWYDMAKKRAASLFKATMLAGGIFADAQKKDLQVLEKAALQIGYAFDIQDDIIGTFASEEQYGRPSGGDLLLGKKPLHIVYALESRKKLIELLRKKELSLEEIEKAKTIIKRCGALDKAKEKLKEHAKKANELIQKTSMSSGSKKFFYGFIDYVAESLEWYK
ncbi:MAG: polyprenyl synthetase family protein [Euryarchaeota archaeon]|nr:polyprenyl synthetase family protein [Euryarchaeota archaeon]